VYVPEQASRALERFFREGNLIALRELALRQTAHRVDAQMRGYMRSQGIRDTWAATDRLAVCIGPDPTAPRLIRAARRMAERLQAQWTAVFVEVPGQVGEDAREAIVRAFRLAEELGGETITLSGASVAGEIMAWAQERNVTRLIVGKPQRGGLRARLRGSLLHALVEKSGSIDVFVITGDADESQPPAPFRRPPPPAQYAWAVGIVALATAVGLALRSVLSTTDIAMLYLLAAVVVGSRVRQRPALLASVLSIALFDFCFVPPYYTFAVHDITYTLTFGMMLAIAIIMSRLTGRIREQADASRAREQRTASAFALSREMTAAREPPEIAAAAARHIEDAFAGRVVFLLGDDSALMSDGVARWAFEHGQMAGLGTSTLPASPALYLPLQASDRVFGVVRVEPRDAQDVVDPERRQQLESFVRQAAVALERAALAERNQASRMEVEAERLRTSLLSSLSHDLRTPLGSIEGAASSLLETGPALSADTRRELAETILDESRRMTRLVANLLDMIRVESGALAVQKQWVPLEEIVGVALIRLDARLADHPVTTSLPPGLPLVSVDDILLEQVFINLLENAAKYTPAGSPIDISASARNGEVTVTVADRGPGIPSGDELKIFEKFYRAPQGDTVGGVGLGLTICRGIVQAHGGRIWAEHRAGGGTLMRFTIPQDGPPPHPAAEELIEDEAR
ncbi:MAG: kdpD, partial [Gemmatimonadetes bacterium]|nr:kdpD [Gemmatimonadota bacterium]